MRREIPLAITIFVGFLAIASFFSPPLEGLGEDFTLFFDIIAVFAFFLGGGNLVRVHVKRLIVRKTDWWFSIVTLSGFLVMLWAGLFKIGNAGGILESSGHEGISLEARLNAPPDGGETDRMGGVTLPSEWLRAQALLIQSLPAYI